MTRAKITPNAQLVVPSFYSPLELRRDSGYRIRLRSKRGKHDTGDLPWLDVWRREVYIGFNSGTYKLRLIRHVAGKGRVAGKSIYEIESYEQGEGEKGYPILIIKLKHIGEAY